MKPLIVSLMAAVVGCQTQQIDDKNNFQSPKAPIECYQLLKRPFFKGEPVVYSLKTIQGKALDVQIKCHVSADCETGQHCVDRFCTQYND